MKKLIKNILHGFALLAKAMSGIWVLSVVSYADQPIMTETLKDNIGLLYQINPDCAKEVLISKTTHQVVKTIYVGSGCPENK